MKKKIAVVVGTRPEAIKMAPVVFALKESSELEPVLLSTGQHREMLDQALGAFGLRPDFDLGLMQPGQTLPGLTARALEAVTGFIGDQKPDAILVQGDTSTVLAASMAAFFAGVPVGHVEAGLRTGNLRSPFPEEMNRRLTAPLATWHFCPTSGSRENLIKEAIPAEHCYVTGNTVVDALMWMSVNQKKQGVEAAAVAKRLGISKEFTDEFLADDGKPFVLITGHRRESFGGGFENICEAIIELAANYPEVGFLYPVHLNPRVQEPVQRILGKTKSVALCSPAGYEDFVWLMSRAKFLLSDSGGVQEEAPSLGKPVLVMRETTERPEGVEAGTCRLVGTEKKRIVQEGAVLLGDDEAYRERSGLRNPYGDGNAAAAICVILEKQLS